jgi:hypothetical protein
VTPRLNSARECFAPCPGVCLVCGGALPAPRGTGRPRLTCSTLCRRRRDRLNRKIARRQDWIDGWRALGAARQVPRARVRAEVAALRADVAELQKG